MKNSHLLRGTLPLLACALNTAAAAPSSVQHEGILSFPLKASSARSVHKRQQDLGVDTLLDGLLYTIDVTIGTPGQTVSLELTTGSDEMWVNPLCSRSTNPDVCLTTGRFTTSLTWVDLNTQGGKQGSTGYAFWNYGYDRVTIGPAVIPMQIFGAAYDTESFVAGQIGVAPSLVGWRSPYPFILDNLVEEKIINSRAFSLDLRGIDSDDGVVIFGGVDTRRYTGSLHVLSVVPAEDSPDGTTRYWVRLNGMSVTREGQERMVFFDGSSVFDINSGSPYSGLPTPLFYSLLEAFPSAIPIPGSGQYAVDCSVADEDGSVEFRFARMVISVPMRDFIIRQPQGCYLGAYQSDSYPHLGANFLRAAYLVFDMDNRQVHIGPSAPGDCGENLVAIGSGPAAVPWTPGSCPASSTSSSSSSMSTSASVSASSSSDISSTITSDSISSSATSSEVISSDSSSSSSAASSTFTSSDEVSSSVISSSVISSSVISSSVISSSILSSDISASSSVSTSTDSSEVLSSSTELSSSVSTSTDSSSISSSSEASSSISESLVSSSATATSISASSSTYSSEIPPETSSALSSAVSSDYSSEPCESETDGAVSTSTFASEATLDSTSLITSSPYGTITSPPVETLTVTATTIYTITSCHYDVPSCTVGEVTTAVITQYTTFCPGTTATYTLPGTYACHRGTCQPGQGTEHHVVTVVPAPPRSTPVQIPGCSEDTVTFTSPGYEAHTSPIKSYTPQPPAETKGSYTTPYYGYRPSVITSITPKNATSTTYPDAPVETAGASIHGVSFVLALAVGILAVLQ